ncbi:insulinase family protein [Candidatus Gottesmanbacteria bacterium]|nr:insulinase family protein [Candidatus Gottesmanbacteria bacterium]
MEKPYQRIVLPNGVRLLLIPMAGVNSVATSVMVGVGSRYETKAINGISHFLEHIVFKGTKKYPTMDDVHVIERIGGLQNAYTDIDITNYHNKVLSLDWELALDINKELALTPKIEEKYINKERDIIIEEMKRYEDEPEAKVEETFHQMMYPTQKLGMRTIGELESLINIASKELKTYHDEWYAPERMVVVLAGNLKSQISMTKQKVEEWFGPLEKKKTGDIEVVTDEQISPRLEVVTKPDAQQAHLELGFRTFARGSDDRFAWNLFNLLMGVSFTSRLFDQIREKRGLCYHIRSSSNNWADVGYWSIYAGVATGKVEEAVKAILAEVSKASQKGVKESEVAVAKKRLKTMLAFKSEDPEFLNEFYGRQEVFDQPIMTLEEYIKNIEKVTKEDIDVLIKKYLVEKTLNMALVWNRPKDNKLESLLRL